MPEKTNLPLVKRRLEESIQAKRSLLEDETAVARILTAAETILTALKRNGKLLICGNGGSASDAMHFAGELVGRFQRERAPWPAIVLGSDLSTMTSVANDYGFDRAYERQVRAFARPEDVLIAISTSGQSENVYRAALAAKERDCPVIALLGRDGGRIAGVSDCPIIVPVDVTARIQECHIAVIHILCELVEEAMYL